MRITCRPIRMIYHIIVAITAYQLVGWVGVWIVLATSFDITVNTR